MDSLIRGNDFAPYPATGRRQALEAQAEAEGIEPLMERLKAIDPDTAARLHLSDRRRIIRALEIYEETGRTMTQHNLDTQAKPPRFEPLWLGLDFAHRQTLYDRIDLRVDRMLELGLMGEIEQLLASGVPARATSLQAIGYKEFVAALEGRCTLDEAIEDVKRGSRRYAKRQLTWFRRNPDMHWIIRQPGEDVSQVFSRAREKAREFDLA